MSNKQKHSYGKFAGIGFQLIIICMGLVFIGKWLDSYFGFQTLFLLISIFAAVFAVMDILIRKLN